MSRISFSSGFLWVFYLLKHAHLICDWTKHCCGSQWPHPCSSDLRQWNPAKHARSPPHLQMLPHHKGMLQKELLACLFATDALTVTFRSLASHSICRSPGTCWFYISPWMGLHTTEFSSIKLNCINISVWNKVHDTTVTLLKFDFTSQFVSKLPRIKICPIRTPLPLLRHLYKLMYWVFKHWVS